MGGDRNEGDMIPPPFFVENYTIKCEMCKSDLKEPSFLTAGLCKKRPINYLSTLMISRFGMH